jgi:RNA recognition motif-containing protein
MKLFQLQTKFFSNSTRTLQKLYVGNLSWTTNEDTLRGLFGKHGDIIDAFIVRDRLTGKSRGFGFIEFSSKTDADAALASLNGVENDGRTLRVNLADAKPPRSPKQF